MLKQIRDARVDLRTGVVIIAIAIALWAAVTYVNMRDFVPDELTPPTRQPPP